MRAAERVDWDSAKETNVVLIDGLVVLIDVIPKFLPGFLFERVEGVSGKGARTWFEASTVEARRDANCVVRTGGQCVRGAFGHVELYV